MPPIPLELFEPVLTARAMRHADDATIETLGLPGRVLMETAGRAVADVIENRLGAPAGKRVLVICGKGNNGGDGFVIARVLHARGARLRVAVAGEPDAFSGDAAANLELLQKSSTGDDHLLVEFLPDDLDTDWPEWVVDALLGIGATPPLRPPFDTYARSVNLCEAPCIAVDVPSGIDSDSGDAAGDAIRADITVTMGAPKAGLLFGDGPRHVGELHVAEIGIPRSRIDEAVGLHGAGFRSTDACVRALAPRRRFGAHKYTAGRVLAIAGSRMFPGAAVLAAQAAARAGAGAVVLATPESARSIVEARLTEVMSVPVAETADGTMARPAVRVLQERAAAADAVLLGPGLGRHPDTQWVIRELLGQIEAPVVIDADGLNALAEDIDLHRRRPSGGAWVLTPHTGEMRRLAGDDDASGPPWVVASAWAQRLRCTLLLKGAPSVVGTDEGEVLISRIATAAMATAGTGDVLSGVIAGLLAQGLEPQAAAIVALHWTGRAAERFARDAHPQTMLASDVIDHLPDAFPG